MPGGIYLIQEGGDLVEMAEQAYDSEDLLQELLENHPALLAGDQIDTTTPRRWLLVSREWARPRATRVWWGGGGRIALDKFLQVFDWFVAEVRAS